MYYQPTSYTGGIMRKSDYGKETTFLWEGIIPHDKINLIEVPSTLIISQSMDEKIKTEWGKIEAKNPNAWDAPKWRTEFVHDDGNQVNIYVSPMFYSEHNVMRHEQGQPVAFYPNPMSINAIQVTNDGYILIGVKGKGSDQKGLGPVGAGFVERYVDNLGKSKTPEKLAYVVLKECFQETKYDKKKDFNMEDTRALGVIFGSNHDTTVGFYVPLMASSKEVDINSNEHDDLLLLPSKDQDICEVLNNGGYKGISASDHLLGCLESYVLRKEEL